MIKISASEFQDEVHPAGPAAGEPYYRGRIERRGVMRFTLKTFDARDDAELYALAVALRWRSMFERRDEPG